MNNSTNHASNKKQLKAVSDYFRHLIGTSLYVIKRVGETPQTSCSSLRSLASLPTLLATCEANNTNQNKTKTIGFVGKKHTKLEELDQTCQNKLLVRFSQLTDLWEHLWRSGESAHLPPLWPGFDSRTWCQMWVEFVVGFSPGPPVFLPPQKPTL